MSTADWIASIDRVLYVDTAAIQRIIAAAYQSVQGGSIHNARMNNQNICDANGVLKENPIFSSFKSIGNLTPEQKQKLDDCTKEITRIKKVKEQQAVEQDEKEKGKKIAEKTLEEVFTENNLSTAGLSEDLKKTTDYDTIQSEIKKILDKKNEELTELKEECFGKNSPIGLSKIQIENINMAEMSILGDLVKDVDKKYEKCAGIDKQIKELQEQKKIELLSASQVTNVAERTDMIEAIEQKYRDKESELANQKAKATSTLEEARLKVTKYGELAAKDGKTIGSDGKEIKAQKFNSEA